MAQTQAHLQITATVVNNISVLQAKAVGLSVLRLVKSMSLDTPPKQGSGGVKSNPNILGRGLYDYTLVLTKPNAQGWLQGQKMANKQIVQWQDVSPIQPVTRQLIQQLQQQPASALAATAIPATILAPTLLPQPYQAGQPPIFGPP
jgi:hypothetical protein